MLKKRFVTAGLIIITIIFAPAAQAAISQDQPSQNESYDWGGIYLGANIGGAFGEANPKTTTRLENPATAYFNVNSDVAQIDEMGADRLSPRGFISGGQAGYNYQRGKFILGLETGFDYFNLSRTQTSNGEVFISNTSGKFRIRHHVNTNWLYSLRPKIGYSIGRFLIYGTGGMALSRIKFNGEYEDDLVGLNVKGHTSTSKTTLGWTLGAGLEYGITRNWSVKTEYSYINFRNFEVESTLNTGLGFQSPLRHEVALESHNVRLGINYKF